MWGYDIYQILSSGVFHFMLSAFVGWLVWRWMLTMHSHTGLKSLMDDFSIFPSWLVLSLSFSIVAHVLQDYTLGWF